jgi:hypothetical protein
MAVSAKKGRASMSNSRAASLQQTQISEFGGRSTGFYAAETQDNALNDEYQQFKQQESADKGPYNRFGPGQAQSSRPMNRHGRSAVEAISPAKKQQEGAIYQSYIRGQDTNVGGYTQGGRSNHGTM